MSRRSEAQMLPWLGGLVCVLSLIGCADCGKQAADKGAEGAPQDEQATEPQHGLSEEQADKVVAKVGDQEITLGEFADRLASQSPYLRARYHSPERRREFLDNMVRFELLAIEAKTRGHDQHPDVKRVREQMMVQQMMKELFDEKGVKLSDITDEEIKQYYEENKQEFEKPAQRRASHILIKGKQQAQAVLEQLKAKPEDMQLFRELARKHNADPDTRDRFGDLRFFSLAPEGEREKGAPPKPLREAAFKLEKTGDLYPELIQTPQGFHILKLTGERAALNRSLDDARRLIQNRLWRKRREAAIEQFVDELREKANVKENLELLSEVDVDVTAPIPGQSAPKGGPKDEDQHGHAHEGAGSEP